MGHCVSLLRNCGVHFLIFKNVIEKNFHKNDKKDKGIEEIVI